MQIEREIETERPKMQEEEEEEDLGRTGGRDISESKI
jgi:hypothetical protein